MLSEALQKTDVDPYPGLRAFTPEESHLFFGREEQIDKLLEKLDQSHFVAVVGPSGCGKSSLVKAGLIPALRTGFFLNAGTKWRIAEMRPGNDPYKNLSSSIAKAFGNSNISLECMKAELKRSPQGLLEVIKSEMQVNKGNFLLVVDQFEELFRYKQNNNIDEVTSFIALLIASANQHEIPIHIILTMRSDFLGNCSLFLGLPEILNDNQFLTPRLTREQTKDAIEGPAMVCGGRLEPKLVTNLLNDIGIDHDQLPLLQHALMRMWNLAKKEEEHSNNNPVETNDEFVLTLDYYNKIGRLNEALSQHANEIFDIDLNKSQRRIAEALFKRLSERNAEQKDNRRIATVEDIAKVAGVDTDEVIKVADIFRKAENSFLMPPPEIDLTPQSFLDISHESLLRQWDKMKEWITKEYDDATLFKRLEADASDYFNENGELLTGIDLHNTTNWRNKKNINEEWASRYADGFKKVDDYIKKSAARSRNRKTLKGGSVLLGVIAVLLTLGLTAQSRIKREKAATQSEIQRRLDSANAQAELQRKIDLVNVQSQRILDSTEAKRKLDSVNIQFKAETQRKLDLADAKRKLDSANALREFEKQQNDYLYKHVSEILQLVDEPFYKSGLMDSTHRNMFTDSLVKLKYKDQKIKEYETLLQDLNTATNIYEVAQKSPNEGLLKAMQFDSTSKTDVSKLVLNYIAKNFFFYTQDTTLLKTGLDYNTRSASAVSNEGKLFAIKLDDTIKIFNINDNGLALSKNIYINTTQETNTNSSKNYTGILNGINTLTFIKEDSLAALINNIIYHINIKNAGVQPVVIPDLNKTSAEKYYVSSISPNAKKLATDYKDYNVKIWDIDNPADTMMIKLDQADGLVYNINFSADNKRMIIKQRDKYKIFTLSDPVNSNLNKTYLYANFTPDNKYIMVQEREGFLDLYDANTDRKISAVNFPEINIDTFKNSTIALAALSPDWRKMIIKTNIYKNFIYTYNTYYFQRNDKDSIFYFNRKVKDTANGKLIKLNYLNSANIFLNNNNILSLNSDYYDDSIKVWKKPGDINSSQLSSFIGEIATLTNTTEKLENSTIDIDTITNKDELIRAATFALQRDARYLQKQTLYNAKKVFGRLAALDTVNYLYDYRRLSLNYYTYYRDTTERLKDLKKITAAEEVLLESNPEDSLKQMLSSDYWNLSWYLLFEKNLDSAAVMHAVLRGLQLYDKNTGINTNLALAYLLTGQCEKADSVYRKFKGQSYLSDARKFTESFQQDLNDLEDAGIITKEKKEIYDHVQRIRQFLKNEISVLDCKPSSK